MSHKNREEMPAYFPLSIPQEGAAGKTGAWRHVRPIVDKETCNGCCFCYIYCPEGVMSKEQEVNFDYCKGCGICAKECPQHAITMEKEV